MITYTQTPDYYNDYLAHYGVKGMKWHKRLAMGARNLYQRGKRKLGLFTGKYTNATTKNDQVTKNNKKFDNKNRINPSNVITSRYGSLKTRGRNLRDNGYSNSTGLDYLGKGGEVGRNNDATRKALQRLIARSNAKKKKK